MSVCAGTPDSTRCVNPKYIDAMEWNRYCSHTPLESDWRLLVRCECCGMLRSPERSPEEKAASDALFMAWIRRRNVVCAEAAP